MQFMYTASYIKKLLSLYGKYLLMDLDCDGSWQMISSQAVFSGVINSWCNQNVIRLKYLICVTATCHVRMTFIDTPFPL